jgi:hypothetical protein
MASSQLSGTGMAGRLRAFGAFWYDFVIGDDWVVAAGIVVGLAGTYLLSRAGITAWWLLPVAVAVLLPASLWRAARGSRPQPPEAAPGSQDP